MSALIETTRDPAVEQCRLEELRALAESTTTTNVPTASRFLGIGANLGYELVARGEWPTRVLRLGKKIRIPTADLLALLEPSEAGAPAAGP
ncbi:MAG TPA: hypothetical protein VGL39_05040 [Jatrophihabitantaceae bacterium]|jgi:hypothetical protein